MSTVRTLIQANEIVNQGLLKAAPLSNRFDASLISPQIDLAEQRFLKQIINKEFYDDLLTQRTTNEILYNSDLGTVQIAFPSNPDYEELFTQWLFPYISRAVLYESYPFISIQTTTNGLQENNPQYGQNSGIKTMQLFRDNMLGVLKGTKPQIVDFLCDNKDKYPLWDSNKYCKSCENSNPIDEGRDVGFVFKK